MLFLSLSKNMYTQIILNLLIRIMYQLNKLLCVSFECQIGFLIFCDPFKSTDITNVHYKHVVIKINSEDLQLQLKASI